MHERLNARLPDAVAAITKSVHEQPLLRRLDSLHLPDRRRIAGCVDRLLELVFPGFFGRQGVTEQNLPFRVGELVEQLFDDLYEPIRYCLRYREAEPCDHDEAKMEHCDAEAARIVGEFFDQLPAVRAVLNTDVQAAFDGDPAAHSTDETVFCYPGLLAITVQRLAHLLYEMDVPLLPRIMTEYAHGRTGIDIHPGATIGGRFFIDHGTGVVIGETCTIGHNVKVYQGVTLGALAPAYGQMLRGRVRHPTIEDDVTIYAGTTILGGETVIGRGTTIGGNVFITASVPPMNQVVAEPPVLKYRDRRPKSERDGRRANGRIESPPAHLALDFQI